MPAFFHTHFSCLLNFSFYDSSNDITLSPVRVRLSDYYEVRLGTLVNSCVPNSHSLGFQVDSVGECDTKGARPRRLENRGRNVFSFSPQKSKEHIPLQVLVSKTFLVREI